MHELQNCVCACVLTTTIFPHVKPNKLQLNYEEIPHDLASMEVCMRHIASLASALIIVKVSINIGRSAYNT